MAGFIDSISKTRAQIRNLSPLVERCEADVNNLNLLLEDSRVTWEKKESEAANQAVMIAESEDYLHWKMP